MRITGALTRLTDALLSVVYPRTCTVCGCPLVAGEELMCLSCAADLPVTAFHLRPLDNPLHERTMCRVPVERAAAMFHYERHSPYAALIHDAKYHGRPHTARLLARRYAAELAPTGFFDGVDLLVPVPLSTRRLITRGYNQSYHIALGISDVTGIAVADNLLHARRHTSQTRMDAAGRLANARGIYSLRRPVPTSAAHVMLVDDVVTTGATLCACAEAIGHSAQVSVIALAAARLA